jgi:hypothetical protein
MEFCPFCKSFVVMVFWLKANVHNWLANMTKLNFLKFNIMQELYEKQNSGGMSKKYTIKHQVGKQKRNTKKRNI